ncbi:EAL domain-containing protein [Methylophaga muralis]|nr:EAL domain-containing protein [Methylophaga muralis]
MAIDDFGMGHSSLSYLRNIEADILKIDMFYIRNMLNDSKNMAIVKTIISTAQIFGMKTLAEGVEDVETANALKVLGCDYAQGYFYSYPLTISEFEEKWIKHNHNSQSGLNS